MTTDTNPLQESIERALVLSPYVRGQLSKIGPVVKRREAERSALAAAVLPIIAAEVQAAKAEAWTDCVSEASALGWLHAPAALDMLGRNPHEKED